MAERYNQKKNIEESNYNIYFKILINHSQQFSVLLLDNVIQYSFNFRNFLDFLNYFSLINVDIMTNKCLLDKIIYDPRRFYNYKLIFITLIPLIFSLISWILWLVYHLLLRKKYKTFSLKKIIAKFLLFLILCTFLFYSLILKTSMAVFQCIHLDININSIFLKESPEIECWNGNSGHLTIVLSLAIPCILLWGMSFPIILYYILNLNRKTISKELRNQTMDHTILSLQNNDEKIHSIEKKIVETNKSNS